MNKFLLLTILVSLAAASLSAPVESTSESTEEHSVRQKRQIPVGFGSSPIGPVDFPVPLTGLGMGVGLGGIGGFGLGGIGGFGGLGLGLGTSRVGITGDAPLEQLAIIEGFGPQGHGPIGMGYGGIGKWQGPYGPSIIPEPFGYGRPFGGVYAGPYGSLDYGPFGAPLSGPINDPVFKSERISKLFKINKELNDRQLLPGLIVRNTDKRPGQKNYY